MNIKICGVTSPEDARLAIDCGADWVGVNLVDASPRRVTTEVARRIVDEVGAEARVVAVVADLSVSDLRRVLESTGAWALQLHGHELPETLDAMLPQAYKALRIGDAADVEQAERYRGDYLLVDTRARGLLGGSGQTFDWGLVRDLAASRRLVLAGGLRPDNVARAVSEARPWGVDVASGVEEAENPRKKSEDKMRAFARAARGG